MKRPILCIFLFLTFCQNGYADQITILKGYLEKNIEETRVLTKALYSSYLDSCSDSNTKFYSFVNKARIYEVEIYEVPKLDVKCLEKKFKHHQKNYPVKSYLSEKVLMLDKVIRNTETIKPNINGVASGKIEITSIFSQRCGERCTFSSEVILFSGNRYWFVRGSNDRGIDAEFVVGDKILIKNSMTTHTRKYIFDINKKSIIRQK